MENVNGKRSLSNLAHFIYDKKGEYLEQYITNRIRWWREYKIENKFFFVIGLLKTRSWFSQNLPSFFDFPHLVSLVLSPKNERKREWQNDERISHCDYKYFFFPFFLGLLKPSKIVPEFLAKVLKISNEIENMSQRVVARTCEHRHFVTIVYWGATTRALLGARCTPSFIFFSSAFQSSSNIAHQVP